VTAKQDKVDAMLRGHKRRGGIWLCTEKLPTERRNFDTMSTDLTWREAKSKRLGRPAKEGCGGDCVQEGGGSVFTHEVQALATIAKEGKGGLLERRKEKTEEALVRENRST